MSKQIKLVRVARRSALCATAALVAGCASAEKTATSSTATAPAGNSSSMSGMNMGASGAGSGPAVNGIKPVPTQVLASAGWQGMKVQARAMTAVPFVVYDGTSEHMVKPPKHTSFHLMVTLDDARTGVAIPYASVWATIRQKGKLVYDERMWPMISEYMGPHYGNDVSLPGTGSYRLSLLVSPPVSARHVEYQNVWLHPHRINSNFTWRGA